eukprot:s2374_g8.t1
MSFIILGQIGDQITHISPQYFVPDVPRFQTNLLQLLAESSSRRFLRPDKEQTPFWLFIKRKEEDKGKTEGSEGKSAAEIYRERDEAAETETLLESDICSLPLAPKAQLGSSILERHPVLQVSLGKEHGVLLSDAGIAFTWGDNRYGQLGRAPVLKEENGRTDPRPDVSQIFAPHVQTDSSARERGRSASHRPGADEAPQRVGPRAAAGDPLPAPERLHPWRGPALPTQLWSSPLLSGSAHCELEKAGGGTGRPNFSGRKWDDAQGASPMSDRPDRPVVPPVLPRLSKDVFTTAPPWPQSARVKDSRTLPGLDNSQVPYVAFRFYHQDFPPKIHRPAAMDEQWMLREPTWGLEAEEAPLSTVLALLPIWACFAVAFSTFVTAFAIIASTQALLYWETIHWPWSRLKRNPKELPSMWDPSSLAASKLQYDSLQRREENLMKRFLSITSNKADENAPWPEHAEQLRALLRGGYLNLDSITSSDGMLDFFASHRVLAHQECLSCCLGIRMTVHYNLFCGTVLALGNDQQCRWLESSQKLGQLGCFMLTEVGAGVLSGLIVETTATWTWENGGGFYLHTPSVSAEKTWISQGLAADWGVVVANLQLTENLGPHVFLVDMTSTGLHRESMGEKTTFNALDNARVSFDQVWLPPDALLSKLCNVRPRAFPDGSLKAEYTFAGQRPPSFVQIAQRLLSGRLCISDSAIAYVEGVLRVTRKYAESRMVWVDKERKMPLAELPYMKKVLHSVEVGLNVHKAFLLILQKEFAEAIESSQDLSRALVTRIAAAKACACVRRAHVLRC